MIVIRDEQIRAMARPMMDRFERRAAKHVETYFLDQARSLGPDALLAGLRECIARAATWGLATERDLLQFITLAFTFGRHFDADPAFPWAARILGDAQRATRMGRLQVHALAARHEGKGFSGPVGR